MARWFSLGGEILVDVDELAYVYIESKGHDPIAYWINGYLKNSGTLISGNCSEKKEEILYQLNAIRGLLARPAL